MLSLSNIFIKYGDRVLFDYLNLTVTDKDKIGLIGRNGAGKSTLLKVIAQTITPDEGKVVRPANTKLGYLHQEMSLPKGKTVMEETLSSFDEVLEMEKRLEEITHQIETRTDYESKEYEKLLIENAELNAQFDLIGGHAIEAEAERVLKGLGFKQSDFHRLTDEFSGGWQMRIELTKMLLQQPKYLLLDEPTNHLDIESIIWLEGFLKDYPGVVIVISHDKMFLDQITNRTVEIELGKIFDYKAPYQKAMLMRAERREKLIAAYENQQKVIAEKERTIKRFMAKATKTSMAQSMQKQLDKMERIVVQAEDTAVMNIRFPDAPRSGLIVSEAKNITKHYGELEVLNGVDFKAERGERIAFVGQNGQGKTTLAKILINEINATDGEVVMGHNVSIGYYAQNQAETLDPNITLLETMELASPPEMRTKLRNILGSFLFSGEDVEKKVVVLSGGERARLALACMMLRPFNLLLLDEPTNHLDIQSKEILKHALLQYNGTTLVVSHDRDFLSGLTHKTIEFRDKKLYEHLGDINFFLEKRAIDNMRDVERQKVQKTNQVKQDNTQFIDRKEQKKLQRQVQNIERKIEKLEANIADLELKMGDVGFYESADAETVMADYQSKKKELENTMNDWETAQEKLDKFEQN